MTLTELLIDKRRLEADIGQLVDRFSDLTDVDVESIEITGENTVVDPATKHILTQTTVRVRLEL